MKKNGFLAASIAVAMLFAIPAYSAQVEIGVLGPKSKKEVTNPPAVTFPDPWANIVVLSLPNRVIIGLNCNNSEYMLVAREGAHTTQGYKGKCTATLSEAQAPNGLGYYANYHNQRVQLTDPSIPGYLWRGCHLDSINRTAAPYYEGGFANTLYFTCVEEFQVP